MPTDKKADAVERIKGWIERCTVAIATDYTGISVNQMMVLRRALRERGVEYHVVKNSLAYLAADAAGRPELKAIVEGPTAIAFGYGEPSESARAVADFIRSNRSSLTIKSGVLGDQFISAQQVNELAMLPSRDQLIARLMAQLQAPVARLTQVLNSPMAGLATVLQRRMEAMEELPLQVAE